MHATVPLSQHIGEIPALPTRRAAGIAYAGTDDITTVHEDGPRCAELFALRELQLLTHMAHGATLIHGHFLFSEAAEKHFQGVYKYITFLRNPVQRVISNYRATTYEKYFVGNFDEYLDSDVGRRHALLNVRYFSGVAEIPRGGENEALELAKRNQDKFELIGFIDQIGLFVSRFNDLFRTRLRIGHYNSAKGNSVSLTPNQQKRLEQLCAGDSVLYERARARFAHGH